MALHDEMLESVGSKWYDVSAFPDSWYESEAAASFAGRALEILEQEYGTAPLFVLKDPRISRFVPFWLSVLETLGTEPSFIIMVRQPLEVAASLEQRDAFLPAHSILLWLRHMLDAERATRGQSRAFLDYDRLLGD
ncbi:MAG: sulfotransferase family protein, partial [Planctomycetes bacterium]|nr:sulfotransferase family protein [Planctomycetota bacterium]